MKTNFFIISICFLLFLNSCDLSCKNENSTGLTSSLRQDVSFLMEKAYFEGQKDALNGDVRIVLNSDSTYVWRKSPWGGGRKPTYFPDRMDSNK